MCSDDSELSSSNRQHCCTGPELTPPCAAPPCPWGHGPGPALGLGAPLPAHAAGAHRSLGADGQSPSAALTCAASLGTGAMSPALLCQLLKYSVHQVCTIAESDAGKASRAAPPHPACTTDCTRTSSSGNASARNPPAPTHTPGAGIV